MGRRNNQTSSTAIGDKMQSHTRISDNQNVHRDSSDHLFFVFKFSCLKNLRKTLVNECP